MVVIPRGPGVGLRHQGVGLKVLWQPTETPLKGVPNNCNLKGSLTRPFSLYTVTAEGNVGQARLREVTQF